DKEPVPAAYFISTYYFKGAKKSDPLKMGRLSSKLGSA
ncbi:MAG: hypothetical protein ACI965_002128, partial [Paraglaciecola sp.]